MKLQPSRALLGTLGILLPLALLLPFPTASAEDGATFVVDTTVDGVDIFPGDTVCATADDTCTLRAAVMEANALPSADRIELGPNFYSLSIPGSNEEAAATGDLDIYGTLTIVGQGMMPTAIDAGGAAMGDRALHVHQGAVFSMEGMTIGYADIGAGANGAGLRNDSGNVTIRNSSFQFNRAHNGAGLMNVGSMSIEHSLIGFNIGTDAGAGVRNDGTLEIDGSSIIENEVAAGPGAGIENHGTLTIRNSTISSNRAGSRGAAIYNGYGPNSGGASLSLNNVTISFNMVLASGGGGDVTGGIYNEPASTVELSNSIVARNAIDYVEAVDCLGPITSRGYNLFSNLEGCTVGGDPSHDIVTAEPGLGSPADLDPAGTVSYPLELGSPALGAGNPAVPGSSAFACEPVDQQDVIRPQGLRCDIGAREMVGFPEPPTSTPGPSPTETDTPTVTPTDTSTPTATSTVTPTPIPGNLFFDGFETGDLSAWSSAVTDQGDLSVSPGAALGGAYGLQADIDDNRSLYVVDTTPANESAYAARFYFDPNGIAMASGNAHVLFKAMDAASRTVYQIELRSYQGDYQIRAQALGDTGSATNTSWFRLHDDVHAIETIWQAASADGASDGSLTLWLDGELAASLAGLDNDTLRVEAVRLGAVAGIDSGTSGAYYFDAFASTSGNPLGPDPGITLPPPPATPEQIFDDGFESGGLSAWSAVKNETDLIVSSSAALVGGFGLEAVVANTAPRYVSDWNPVSLKAYAARFYFDPNSISMASGNSHMLFKAVDAASKTAFQLELRSYQGDYQIRAYAPWDSGGAYTSPWFRLSDDPHLLELIWQAASADGARDGLLSLSIDAEVGCQRERPGQRHPPGRQGRSRRGRRAG